MPGIIEEQQGLPPEGAPAAAPAAGPGIVGAAQGEGPLPAEGGPAIVAGAEGEQPPLEESPLVEGEQPPEEEEAPPPEDPRGEASNADQEAYDKVVMAASKLIYSDEANDGLVEQLKQGAKNAPQTVAETGSMLLMHIDEKSGGKLPVEVLIPAAEEILAMIGELGEKAGFFEFGEPELSVAMQHTIATIGEQYGADPEEIKVLMEAAGGDGVERARAQQAGYAAKYPMTQPGGQPDGEQA